MKSTNCVPTVAIVVFLCFGQLVLGQQPANKDIEETGAFLVKLGAGAKSTRADVSDDWRFTPLVSETQTREEGTAVGNWWYLSRRPGATRTRSASAKSDWDSAYDFYASKAASTRGPGTKTPLSKRGIEPQTIEFIEPDLGFFAPVATVSSTGPTPSPSILANKAIVGSSPTRHWPRFKEIGSYQDDGHSQLASAREMVKTRMFETHGIPVRVAFLDTGYDPKHVTCPRTIKSDLARNFVEDKTTPDGASLEEYPGRAGTQSHGTGTLGIFGGGEIDLIDSNGKSIFSGTLGGAPFVEIAPMRVATWVVHFEDPLKPTFVKSRPSGTTRAIFYAIRNNCDVISMSHGGLPSRALADAINAAYQTGIAMFFASGDYLKDPDIPVVHSPRYVVYPAAFSRAMAVCGVTADDKTYGFPPGDEYDPNLGPVNSWRLRGNWGPPAWMKNAIAAYSPNIPWAHWADPKNNNSQQNIVDLDGQGTSSSTPQAAAAAALWLQYYRDADELRDWRSWKKAELVYCALRTSAKHINDPSDGNYSAKYFGSGVLQAKGALSKKPQDLHVQPQKEAGVGLGWMRLFTSIGPGTRAAGTSEEILKQMGGLELAQVAQRSARIQEILEEFGGYDPDGDVVLSPEDEKKFRKELFEEVKNDPHASQHLRDTAVKELTKL